jgi:A/G-specific adenine glycosylase
MPKPTPPADKNVFVRRLLLWGRMNRRDFPWRNETDPFKVLVAELMLQRSRGVTVDKVYRAFFSRWPTIEHLTDATEAEISQVIRPLGLTRRAATLKALAQAVLERGGVPPGVPELMDLPGIGRYAASAAAAVAFNRHAPTVDGVSARVYRRYFGLSQELPAVGDAKLWERVGEVTPRGPVREWNWAVLDLAAAVCLPKVPRCAECPLQGVCLHSIKVAKTVSTSP